ncbi:uncharacterized protein EI90DRAFT_3064945, partial [Cantharellus anzutake]|uniref:uncharacterized protein n=1 Tax=Cantharellus anzutake TaxID=1750568 RepID=UPI0019034CBF
MSSTHQHYTTDATYIPWLRLYVLLIALALAVIFGSSGTTPPAQSRADLPLRFRDTHLPRRPSTFFTRTVYYIAHRLPI